MIGAPKGSVFYYIHKFFTIQLMVLLGIATLLALIYLLIKNLCKHRQSIDVHEPLGIRIPAEIFIERSDEIPIPTRKTNWRFFK